MSLSFLWNLAILARGQPDYPHGRAQQLLRGQRSPRHSLYVLQRDLLGLGAGVDPLLDVQGRQSQRRAAFHFHSKALLEHVAAALEEIGSGEL